jgi:hypothetical protein
MQQLTGEASRALNWKTFWFDTCLHLAILSTSCAKTSSVKTQQFREEPGFRFNFTQDGILTAKHSV